jgi:hypothetical protein
MTYYSFQNLLERNISSDLFNNFLTVKELTKLQFTCKSICSIIYVWKQKYELRLLEIENNDTTSEDEIRKIVKYGHRNIYEIVVLSKDNSTAVGYHYLTNIKNLTVLRVQDITPEGLRIIASSLFSLTKLHLFRTKFYAPSLSAYDFNLLTDLTNLKTLSLDEMHYFSNEAAANFHKLNLQSLSLCGQTSLFDNIEEISFLSTLTTLKFLKVGQCKLKDQNVRSICQNCLLLEVLDIRNNFDITPVGFGLSIENIQNLTNLKVLHFNFRSFNCWKNLSVEWWKELTNLPSLKFINLGGSVLSEDVWSHSEKIFNFEIEVIIDLTENFIDLTEEESIEIY